MEKHNRKLTKNKQKPKLKSFICVKSGVTFATLDIKRRGPYECAMFWSIKKVLLENKSILMQLMSEITRLEIKDVKESNISFGYQYSKPFMFLDTATNNGETVFIALQESYENVMRKETLALFLLSNEIKKYDINILIILNLFEKNQTSENRIEERVELSRRVIDLNVLMDNNQDDFLSYFLKFVDNYNNPYVLESEFSNLKKLKIEYDKEIYNKSRHLFRDIEIGIHDRVSLMGDKQTRKNVLYKRAIELFVLLEVEQEYVQELFPELEKDELADILQRYMVKFKVYKYLLESNYSKKQIKKAFDESDYCYILNLADEHAKISDK